MANADFGYCK